MKTQKFLFCTHCGNLVAVVNDAKVPIICCGEKMVELVPGSIDASLEKHVPEVKVDGDIISIDVGSVEHPMIPEHYIMWIALETEDGIQIKHLNPEDKPSATFAVANDSPKAVYAYCNLHGLWKKDV